MRCLYFYWWLFYIADFQDLLRALLLKKLFETHLLGSSDSDSDSEAATPAGDVEQVEELNNGCQDELPTEVQQLQQQLKNIRDQVLTSFSDHLWTHFITEHVSAAVVRPKHKVDGTRSFSTPYRTYETWNLNSENRTSYYVADFHVCVQNIFDCFTPFLATDGWRCQPKSSIPSLPFP